MKLITDNNIWQNAWVVPDARAAAMHWVSKFGAGPFYYGEFNDSALSDLVYRGQPGSLNIMVAVGFAGSMQYEMIERLDDNPNPATTSMAFDKIGNHENFQNVLFIDGHVEGMEW